MRVKLKMFKQYPGIVVLLFYNKTAITLKGDKYIFVMIFRSLDVSARHKEPHQ